MKLKVIHIVIMIICLSALIISSETIKIKKLFENFQQKESISLNQKIRNNMYNYFNKKFIESINLKKK